MFKKEIWDKFTESTFLKFWNLPSETKEISKFQKVTEELKKWIHFPQISRINMWLLVNHMLQAHKGKSYTKITQSISTNLIKITP